MSNHNEQVTDVLGINYSSKDWFHVKQIALRRIDDCVSKLCGEIDERETNKLRGCILAYKAMIGLEEDARSLLAQNERNK
jgi:hypothetical protein